MRVAVWAVMEVEVSGNFHCHLVTSFRVFTASQSVGCAGGAGALSFGGVVGRVFLVVNLDDKVTDVFASMGHS